LVPAAPAGSGYDDNYNDDDDGNDSVAAFDERVRSVLGDGGGGTGGGRGAPTSTASATAAAANTSTFDWTNSTQDPQRRQSPLFDLLFIPDVYGKQARRRVVCLPVVASVSPAVAGAVFLRQKALLRLRFVLRERAHKEFVVVGAAAHESVNGLGQECARSSFCSSSEGGREVQWQKNCASGKSLTCCC
jgi:hypothetical protein